MLPNSHITWKGMSPRAKGHLRLSRGNNRWHQPHLPQVTRIKFIHLQVRQGLEWSSRHVLCLHGKGL